MLIIDASCPVNCGDCPFIQSGQEHDHCCICSEEVDDFECGERPDFCPIKGEVLDYEIGENTSASDLIKTNAEKNQALIKLLGIVDERVDDISDIVSGIQNILLKERTNLLFDELKEKAMKATKFK